MKPGPVVPTPEGVIDGAPAVERKGADTPPPTGNPLGIVGTAERDAQYPSGPRVRGPHSVDSPAILSWAPERSPLPDERPSEHIRNALQIVYELETLLQASGDYTQPYRACMADVKRRLGWALRGLVPHAQ